MTLESVSLFFGVIFSLLEMRRRGILKLEDFDRKHYHENVTLEEFNTMEDDYFTDFWPEWYRTGSIINGLHVQNVPHDIAEGLKEWKLGDEYFIVGVILSDSCDLDDMIAAKKEFEMKLNENKYPEDDKYLSFFKEFTPKFHLIANDCKCCS